MEVTFHAVYFQSIPHFVLCNFSQVIPELHDPLWLREFNEFVCAYKTVARNAVQ